MLTNLHHSCLCKTIPLEKQQTTAFNYKIQTTEARSVACPSICFQRFCGISVAFLYPHL